MAAVLGGLAVGSGSELDGAVRHRRWTFLALAGLGRHGCDPAIRCHPVDPLRAARLRPRIIASTARRRGASCYVELEAHSWNALSRQIPNHGTTFPRAIFRPGVKWLLIVNIALFVLYFFAVRFDFGVLFQHFALVPGCRDSPAGPLATGHLHVPARSVRVLAHPVQHADAVDVRRGPGARLGHAAIPALLLSVRHRRGGVRGGGQLAARAAWGARTIGSSGAIYGLLLAFGMLYPDRVVLFSFLFPIKAKYFVMILGAIDFPEFDRRQQRQRQPRRAPGRHAGGLPLPQDTAATRWTRWRASSALTKPGNSAAPRAVSSVYLHKHRGGNGRCTESVHDRCAYNVETRAARTAFRPTAYPLAGRDGGKLSVPLSLMSRTHATRRRSCV